METQARAGSSAYKNPDAKSGLWERIRQLPETVQILLIAALVGVVALVWYAGPGGDPPSGNGRDASEHCVDNVTRMLKAPTTAEFSGITHSEVEDNEWRVRGYVDSQNSFGAMIRTEWSCYAVFTPGTQRWTTDVSVLD